MTAKTQPHTRTAETYDKYDRIFGMVFKAIILLFILGLIIFLFIALIDGDKDRYDLLTAGGISIGGISTLMTLFMRYEVIAKRLKSKADIKDEMVGGILEKKLET